MEETGFLPGYCAAIKDPSSHKRYKEKLQIIDNIDPYELKMSEWRDAVELWPAGADLGVGQAHPKIPFCIA